MKKGKILIEWEAGHPDHLSALTDGIPAEITVAMVTGLAALIREYCPAPLLSMVTAEIAKDLTAMVSEENFTIITEAIEGGDEQ